MSTLIEDAISMAITVARKLTRDCVSEEEEDEEEEEGSLPPPPPTSSSTSTSTSSTSLTSWLIAPRHSRRSGEGGRPPECPRLLTSHQRHPSLRGAAVWRQESVTETENESNAGMGRVDEGVEEFFTKKILPDSGLKGRWEESNPARATPPESGSTPSAPTTPLPSSSSFPCNITASTSTSTTTVTSPSVPPSYSSPLTHTNVTSANATPPFPASIAPPTSTAPPPAKNIKKKFGDFFAFKRARAGRAAKAGGERVEEEEVEERVQRTSIADLIRPLREAKERERERERSARSLDDANVSNGAAVTEGAAAVACAKPRPDDADPKDRTPPPTRGAAAAAGAAPPRRSQPQPSTSTAAEQLPPVAVDPGGGGGGGEEAGPVSPPAVTSPTATEWEAAVGVAPDGERRLKVTRRSLREGKSQSLILLTGLEAEDKDSTHSKVIGQKFGEGMLIGPLPAACQPSSATPARRKKRCGASQLPSPTTTVTAPTPTTMQAATERKCRFTSEDLDKIQQQLEENLLPSSASSASSKNRPSLGPLLSPRG
ncbi:LOW QUALITY PROTEIN: hypothetical protein CRUP_022815 [Coryphaenoides rupestris]|nr:LOW QUALITY PROTEIN: hypothetical protein CRUP_022815 [Coryphaenoides rupestris]